MKEANKSYCDVSKVHLAPISKDIARDIIVKKHYTHAWTMCRYALGIYYKTESENQFGDSKLIGCLIYGFPVGARASTSVCEGLTKDNIFVAVHDITLDDVTDVSIKYPERYTTKIIGNKKIVLAGGWFK